MNQDILVADRLFRNKEWQEALEKYKEALDKERDAKEKVRLETSAKICAKKISHQIEKRSSAPKPNHQTLDIIRNILAQKIVTPGTREVTPCYTGEVVTDSGIVDISVLLNHFAQSPWQTSIGIASSLLLRDVFGLGIIQEMAQESLRKGDLSLSSIIYAYLSPIGLGEFVTTVATHRDLGQAFRIAESSIALMCTTDKLSPCDYANPENLSALLRFTSANCKRYILERNQLSLDPQKSQSLNQDRFETCGGSIFLNEEKFIQKCVFNHYPMLDKWYIVEGACKGYPANKITKKGFSKDYSWLKLELCPDPCRKLHYIAYGWTHSDGENAKSELRNQYIKKCNGSALVVIDIDEFYSRKALDDGIQKLKEGFSGVTLPQVHLWKATNRFITGGYYDVSHMRFFLVCQGFKYISNHNFPETPEKIRLDKINPYKFHRVIKEKDTKPYWEEPYCCHLGFAKNVDDMRDKTNYYLNRGEAETRPVTTSSRSSWFTDVLPPECRVYPYSQSLPKVLQP
ncbi:MAG: hypothetical protein NTV57_18320 [Cyanobacteria bacterium]|nr:hypothetical protein [Cyanobacteriota bacterium]